MDANINQYVYVHFSVDNGIIIEDINDFLELSLRLMWFLDSVFLLFLTVLFIQLGYYILIFSRLAFLQTAGIPINDEKPVSVIICAKNEESSLEKSPFNY